MSGPRIPLPPALTDRPFSVAVALDAGLSRKRLRGADLARPTLGVRALREPANPAQMALVFATALPKDVAFSHVTAARLLGIPLPAMWRPDEPIHVMRSSSAPPIQRAGCASHRGLERRRVAVVGGLRVVGPADTWCDLGTVVGLDDLVAAADALLAPPWDVPATRLAAAAEGRSGRSAGA